MYILMWEFGSTEQIYECKIFNEKHDVEDFLNHPDNRWLHSAKPRVSCGTESRLEKLQVESYVVEEKLKIYP